MGKNVQKTSETRPKVMVLSNFLTVFKGLYTPSQKLSYISRFTLDYIDLENIKLKKTNKIFL